MWWVRCGRSWGSGILVACLLSAACGEDEPPIATTTPWDREVARRVMVRGLVTDGESGQPVVQAEISLPEGERAVTDAEGRFSLETTPGRKRVEVRSSEHLRFTYELVAGEVEFDSSIRVARRGPMQAVGVAGGTLVSEEAAIEIPPGAYPDGSSVSITALKRSRVAAVPAPAQFVDDTGTPRRVVGVVALQGSSAPAMSLRVRTPVAPDATMDTVLLHEVDGSGEWVNPKRPESIVAGMATFAVDGDGQYGVSMDAARSDARRIGYVVTEGGDSAVGAGSVLTGGTKLTTGRRVVALVDPRGAAIEVAPSSLVSLDDPAAADGSGGAGTDGGVEGTAAPFAGRVRALAGAGRVVMRRRAAVAGRILLAPAEGYKLTLALPTVTLAVKGTAFTFASCTAGGGDMDTVGVVEGELDAFYLGDKQAISAGQSRIFCPTCPAGAMPSCGEAPAPPLLARLGVSPSEVAFDDLPSGETSAPRTLVVTNLGNGPTGTLTSGLGGGMAAAFEIQVNGCAGVVLEPGASCAVAVAFKPTAAGIAEGEATVTADPGGTASVILSGRGLAPPRLSVSPGSAVFDPQGMGTPGPLQAFVVRNDGDQPTGALETRLQGGGPAHFLIASDGCAGRVLEARGFCRVELRFRPGAVGEVEGELAVSGAPGGTATAALRGRGLEPALLTVSSREVAFGDQLVGTTGAPRAFEVSNAGEVPAGPLAVTLVGGEAFELVEDGCQGVALLPGGVCRLGLRFHARAAGAATGSLALAADPGGAVTVALAGNGLAAARLAVSPALAPFADTLLGAASAPALLVFSNEGDVPTGTLAVALAGAGAGQFHVASDGCAGVVLAARTSCSIQATFQPELPGAALASITVTGAPGGAASAELRGRGLTPAGLVAAPPAIGFGEVLAGTASAPAMVSFTNPGDVPTGALVVALGGAGAGAFAIASDGCGGMPLAAGASCVVSLVFGPAGPGPAAARVTASDAPGGSASAAVALSGRGLAPARLGVAPGSVPFGDRLVGSASEPATITVTNEGDVPSGPLAAALTGVSVPQFQLAAEGCQGVVLGPRGTCTMAVTFAPALAGDALAALLVSATPGDTASVALSGKGLAPAHLVVAPATVPFADQLTGTAGAPVTVTFHNDGDVPTGALAVVPSGAVGQFPLGADGCTGVALAPQGSCTVALAFAPTVPGESSASVTASATPGGSAAVAVSGRGLAPAALAASPAALSFPDQLAGTASVAAIATFTNEGDVPSGSVVVVLGGTSAGQFQITSNGCAGGLPAKGACLVSVVFAPTAAGAASATLGVTATPGGSASVALGGRGLAPARLTVTPPAAAFGDVLVGSTGAPGTVTVTNEGDVASGPLAAALTGVSAPQYQLGAEGCQGIVLGPRGACTMAVTFAPTAAGDALAALFVSATPGDTASVALSGKGLAPARLAGAPATVAFGDRLTGTTGAPATITFSNDGDVPTGALAVATAGGSGQFPLGSDGCSGVALAAQGSCTVTLAFAPTAAGESSATLTASGAPGGSAAVALSGRGLAPARLSAAPPAISFPDQLSGTASVAATATFSNDGDVPSGSVIVALAGAGAGQFQITSNGCAGPLAARAACTVAVVFAPTAAGAASATLGASAEPGGAASIPLAGTGLQPAHLTAAPTSAAFGDVLVGSAGAPATITVTNDGDVASGPLTTGLGGVSAPQYQILSNGCEGLALAGKASCTIGVALAPTAAGDANASLFASATPGGATLTSLAGRALAPARIRVAPTEASFGAVLLGDTSAAAALVVTNDGDVATGPLGTTLEGAAAAQFQVVSNGCFGVALAGKASCTVELSFRPTVTGDSSAGFVVTGAPGAGNASLSGRGLAPAGLVVEPPALAFGDQTLGTTSAPRPVTFTNPGDVATGPLGVALGGPGSPAYRIESDACSGVPLVPRSSCTVMVSFQPSVAGDAGPAALAAAGAPGGSASAALGGRGSQPPRLRLDPADHDLGSVAVGHFADFVFTASNTGGGPSGTLALSLEGPDPGDFSIVADGCTGQTLAPEATCLVSLRFSPHAAGGRSVGATVHADPGGFATALLRGSGRDGGSCTPGSCGEGLLCCGEGTVCADPRIDANHCGGCGNVCPPGRVCNGGVCGCHPLQTECDGVCSSLQDADNCGACGNVCPEGNRHCTGGPTPRCEPCSAAGQVDCGGRCVDLQQDQQNCGGCGQPCGANQACVNGVCATGTCALTCGPGSVCCEGGAGGAGQRCTDLRFDGSHCGACGVACGGGRVCNNGVCGCPPGQVDCNGTCTNLQGGDPDNCGGCGSVCPQGIRHCAVGPGKPTCQPCSTIGQSECGGRCVDTGHDENHCGGCGNACAANQACVEGACVQGNCGSGCGTGAICCTVGADPGRDVCIDPRFDQNHCGGCDNPCPAGQLCQDGRCGCGTGQTICDGVCRSLQQDPDNCGACGNVCPPESRFCVGGPTPSCRPCPGAGQSLCDGRCVDTRSDRDNCGACGTTCGEGQSCLEGACVTGTCQLSCPGGMLCCGTEPGAQQCSDPRFDRNNCGGCGIACAADKACLEGVCACDPMQTDCGGTCRRLFNDPDSCGACGNVCPPGNRFCNGGSCQPCAIVGQTECDGRCVDTGKDQGHCGACGNACGAGQSCVDGRCLAGTCQLSCPAGMLCCGGGEAGPQLCADPRFDRNNCGGCGIVCPATQSCVEGACACEPMRTSCAGICALLFNDPDNCGACGNVCPAESRFCSGGRCEPCALVGQTECGGRCVDTGDDLAHCGACGNACGPGQACVAGRCLSGSCQMSCPAGMLCCGGGEAGPQLCADARFDRNNCGGCGIVCPATQSCIEGGCACEPMRTSCDGACVLLFNDAQNCGACGNVCPEGARLCNGGRCESCAVIGQTECNNRCVDTRSDHANCGACNTPCAPNQACIQSACVSGQ